MANNHNSEFCQQVTVDYRSKIVKKVKDGEQVVTSFCDWVTNFLF